ncbi:MAG: hypothetical protein EHM72_14150, partial [Calditrichaeota bacterium]
MRKNPQTGESFLFQLFILYSNNGKSMKNLISAMMILSLLAAAKAQETPSVMNLEWENLKHAWRAPWITHPTASPLAYGLYHLRRTFDLGQKPEKLIIHVSGDNRYRLYVNGQYVCNGPARGDQQHWPYETLDISPYLRVGVNVIAAQLINFGEYRPVAQHSFRTAFILQADDEEQAFIDTGENWKIIQNNAVTPISVMEADVHGFYALAPGDRIDASLYPWGWQEIDFDDSDWQAPKVLLRGVGRGYMHGEGWYLIPRQIPLLEEYFEAPPR